PFRGLGSNIQVNTPTVFANEYNRRTPYTIQYLLNVQRELSGQTLLEVGYLGSVSRKGELFHFQNVPLPGTTPIISRIPYQELNFISYMSGQDKANYNALATKLERRFSEGLTYLLGYTFSRTINI